MWFKKLLNLFQSENLNFWTLKVLYYTSAFALIQWDYDHLSTEKLAIWRTNLETKFPLQFNC